MKKYLIYLSAVLALVACVKKVPEELEPLSLEGRTTVDARIASLLLGEGTRVWPEGAAIGVCGSLSGTNEKYRLRKADEQLADAIFYGPEVKGEISACYPWEPSYTGAWGRMTAMLDNRQRYIAGNSPAEQFLLYSPMAFAFASDGKLDFAYPFGMLSLTVALEEDLLVEGITVKSESLPFAGTGIVSAEGISFGAGALHQLELVFDEPVPIRDEAGNPVPYYLVLPPYAYPDLELVFHFSGEQPFACHTGAISVPRIAAESFRLLSMVIYSDGPEAFTPVNVHFDE